mmetsp:Transcript_84267/g.239411  ORF Transcript_84267/g.239411 Transcript_84267/m.239411 type:complete len:210 (+) Transcript_84267:294-923(+)
MHPAHGSARASREAPRAHQKPVGLRTNHTHRSAPAQVLFSRHISGVRCSYDATQLRRREGRPNRGRNCTRQRRLPARARPRTLLPWAIYLMPLALSGVRIGSRPFSTTLRFSLFEAVRKLFSGVHGEFSSCASGLPAPETRWTAMSFSLRPRLAFLPSMLRSSHTILHAPGLLQISSMSPAMPSPAAQSLIALLFTWTMATARSISPLP